MKARRTEFARQLRSIAGLSAICGLGVYLLYIWVASVPIVDLRL